MTDILPARPKTKTARAKTKTASKKRHRCSPPRGDSNRDYYNQLPTGVNDGDLWRCPECKTFYVAQVYYGEFIKLTGLITKLRARKRFRRER